ncbi:MAG: nitroreductase family protein [Myxococcales bacterium]|nr:MAG: nitroreductase family protein [Myxococcales bacterium]
MIDWILKRRSIRKYTSEDVSEAQVTEILKAAMAAPTANNVCDWEFVVVRDPAVKRALAAALPHGKMTAEAPLAIVVVGRTAEKYAEQDCAAATENILLAVTSLGLGAVWLGMKDPDRVAGVTKAVGLPEGRYPFTVIPIGHPAEDKPPRTQYDPAKIFQDRYGRR